LASNSKYIGWDLALEWVGLLKPSYFSKFKLLYFEFETEIFMADSWGNKSLIFCWGFEFGPP
jgi:hypothetical protein